MTSHAQIESHKEYFLQFNYVYAPDKYIGLWWQFRNRMMSEEEAKAFITQIAPLGTMDYSLLHRRTPIINTKYGVSLPIPHVTLTVRIVVILLIIAGIPLGCHVHWMGKTFKVVTGTVKRATENPFLVVTSCFLECSSAHNPLHLHLSHDDNELSRTYLRQSLQKSTQSR